jgi:hypothetical protein
MEYPRSEKFCEQYHKHYVLLYIGEFNKWTAVTCGLVIAGTLIALKILNA